MKNICERPRGRPRKIKENKKRVLYSILLSDTEGENDKDSECLANIRDTDVVYHAFLAELLKDPQTYKEAISSNEKNEWIEDVRTELNSLEGKEVF